MRGTKIPCSLGLLAAILASSLAATASFANTYSWNSLATSTTWNVTSNWSAGGPPSNTDVAEFNSSSYALQPSLTAAAIVGGLWDTGSGTVGIGGSALTLNGATIANPSTGIEMDSGAGAMTISASLALGGAQQWLNNSSSLLQVGAVATSGNTLTVAGSGNYKFTGALSGAGGLTVSGGSASFTVATTLTGSTNVTGGTLNLAVGAGLGSTAGLNVGPGGTVLVTAAANTWVLATAASNNAVTISGRLVKSSAGNYLSMNQANTILSGGTLQSLDLGVLNSNSTLGFTSAFDFPFEQSGSFNAPVISTLANSGTSVITAPTGGYLGLKAVGGVVQPQSNQPYFTTGSNSTLDVNVGLVQLNTNTAFENGVNISGSGTVVFAPPAGFPNIYSHNTDIISGTLQVGSTGAIPFGLASAANQPLFASNVQLDGGATAAGTLDLAGNSIYINGLQGVSGAVTGRVINSGTSTATLTDLTYAGSNSLSGATTYSGVLADGASKLALAVAGTGSLTLTSSNSYSGGTTIGSQTVQTIFGTVTTGPGTLILGSSATLGNGNITISPSGLLDVSNYPDPGYNITGHTLTAGRTTTPATDINGSLNLTHAALILNTGGTLTLSGSNSASGSLTLTNGTLGYGPNNLVSLAGALSLGGTDYVAITSTLASSSTGTTYTLITGNSPVAGFVANDWIVTGNTNTRQQYSVGTSGDALTLSITGVAGNLLWTGTGAGGTPYTWDTNTSPNWFNLVSMATDKFQSGDNVTFTDSAGSAAANVLINSIVQPGSITVSNTNVGYTFSGSGSIGGTTGLVMNGPGALTITTSNVYSGGTTLNGGLLNVNNSSGLGSGTLTINGGTLDNSSGTAITLSTNNPQTWNSNFAFKGSNNLNLGTGAVTLGNNVQVTVSGGSLTVGGAIGDLGAGLGLTTAGSGMLNLTNTATYSGLTTVTAGTLAMGVANTLPNTAGITVGQGATLMTTVGDGVPGGTVLSGSMLISGLFLKGPGNFAEQSQLTRTSIVLSGGTIASADLGAIGVQEVIQSTAPALNEAFIWGAKGPSGGTISTAANSGNSYISVPSSSYFWLCTVGGAQPLSNMNWFVSGANSTLNVNTSLAQFNVSPAVGDGINISGSGTVVFNPPAGYPNLYADNTNIVSGTLKLGGTGAIPYGVIPGSSISSNVELDGSATAAGTLDLNGNSIFVNGLQGLSGAVAGTVINSATGTTATLTDLTLMASSLQAAGASGASTTVYSGVLADNAGTGGKLALVVGGTGSLTLTSSNTYSGGTTIGPVTAGTLAVGGFGTLILGPTGTLGSGKITIASGGFLDVSNYSDPGYSITGTTLTAGRTSTPATDINGSLNLQNSALILNTGGTLTFSAANFASGSLTLTNGTLGYGSNNLISLAGNLALGGSNYVDLTGPLTTGDTYTLVTASSVPTPTNMYVFGDTSPRQTYSFASANGGTALTLTVSGYIGNLIWAGTGGTPNTWDTNTSPNWYDLTTSSTDKFQNGDYVTFTDSAGSAHANVLINSTVLPGSVTVSNTNVSYTFSGSGSIGGTTSLVVSGPGTLTIANTNSYTGGTFINGGTLKVGNANALPNSATAGNVVLGGAGGVLDLAGMPLTYINGLSGGGAAFGQVINSGTGTATLSLVNGGAAAAYSGVIADNNGLGGKVALLMSGTSGLQNLSGSNTYSGGTQVTAGTLQVDNTNALGTGAVAANGGVLDLAGYNVTVPSFSGAAGTVTNSVFGLSTLTVNQATQTTFGGTLQDGLLNSSQLGLTMAGGTLGLTGATLYSGSTTISGGVLALAGGGLNGVNNLPNTAGITIAQGAALVVTGSDFSLLFNNGPPLTFQGNTMNISGLFLSIGDNTAEGNQLSRTNIVLSGGTIASAGVGVINAITPNGTALNEALVWGTRGPSGGTISTAANSGSSLISVPASGYFLLCTAAGSQPQSNMPYFSTGASSTLYVDASMSNYNNGSATNMDGINISGSGTVVFAPPAGYPNVYSRNTNIISGTLQVGNTGAIPFGVLPFNSGGLSVASNVVLDGGASPAGTLDLNGFSIAVNSLSGASGAYVGQVINSATGTTATLTEGYYTTVPTVFAGVLANGGGTLALTVMDTNSWTLTGTNTYTGLTTISAGTLQLGDGLGDDGSIGKTSGVVNNSALVYNIVGNQVAAYNISGGGSVTSLGTGTVTLSGTNGYQGGTLVENGTLIAANDEAIADGTSLIVGNDISAFGGVVPAASGGQPAVSPASPVPEPGTLALLGMGLCAAAAGRRIMRSRRGIP
jgi:fibronectin-binding autotransporter adhesin